MKVLIVAGALALGMSTGAAAQCYYNCAPRNALSTNPYAPNSVTNPYSPYGSRHSNQSVTNPYATQAPKIVDGQGNYYGRASANRYDPDSTSNPYGRYGSRYSPDSLNNPYGAGNPYSGKKLYLVPDEE